MLVPPPWGCGGCCLCVCVCARAGERERERERGRGRGGERETEGEGGGEPWPSCHPPPCTSQVMGFPVRFCFVFGVSEAGPGLVIQRSYRSPCGSWP